MAPISVAKKPVADETAIGHRARLRDRFLTGGAGAVTDYELLELILFGAHGRCDVKPLAKRLLIRFVSLKGVMGASVDDLMAIDGMGTASVSMIRAAFCLGLAVLREDLENRPLFGHLKEVLVYCQANMEHLQTEQLRLLFLDKKNYLIRDEVQQTGTVDHTPVYPREVLKRALDLGASGFIMVHNHPSGDPTPSKADIDLTRRILDAAERLNIQLLDHIVIGKYGRYTSMRGENLL